VDPYFMIRADRLVPLVACTDRAFAAVAAFYGMERERDIEKAVRNIQAKITNLQEYDWRKLQGDRRDWRAERLTWSSP
jgi:hypothetical protein